MPSIPTGPAMPSLPPQEVEALARQYGRRVFDAAYRVLGRRAAAEDVQQDVFLRLLEKAPGRVESWPALLTTLAVRSAIDRLRRHRRWQRLLPVWRAGQAGVGDSTEQAAVLDERAARLRQALARLRPREAACFTLRCIQGMELADIAAAMEITVNHVSVCLHRAVRALEADLGDATPVPEIRA